MSVSVIITQTATTSNTCIVFTGLQGVLQLTPLNSCLAICLHIQKLSAYNLGRALLTAC